jgi:hypothetical protein
MLEGIIRWLTETPYPNLRNGMPPQYQELHKQQAAWSEHWRILQQQHLYNNNISCDPRNNDIGWISGHITLIWNEIYSTWKLRNQDRHGKEEELQRQIKLDQETNTGPIPSSTSL